MKLFLTMMLVALPSAATTYARCPGLPSYAYNCGSGFVTDAPRPLQPSRGERCRTRCVEAFVQGSSRDLNLPSAARNQRYERCLRKCGHR